MKIKEIMQFYSQCLFCDSSYYLYLFKEIENKATKNLKTIECFTFEMCEY